MSQEEQRVNAWLQLLEKKIVRYGNRLLKDTDITVTQLRVLKYLKIHMEKPQIADMSEFFDVTHPSMIHVVKSLEVKGYVYREPIGRGRGKKILLTDKGKQLAEENEKHIEHLEEIMLDNFSKEEKTRLIDMLKKISENMNYYFKE